jgi:GntR family transcriptional regulator
LKTSAPPGPPIQDQRLPRYHRVRDALSTQIASRHWRPDEPIPTEAELAQTHAVSIGTIRKAVDSLVADGVLERFQGRGTFVRRPDFQSSLFRFFRFIDADGAARVPVSRILKREEIAMPAAVAAALQFDPGAPAIRFIRLRLIDERPLLLEDIWLPRDRFKPLLKLDLREFGDLLYPLYEQFCGALVASAQETLTAEAAGARHARFLELPVRSPIIVIERVALGADRQPLEWRQSRGPADQFRYQVEIR